MAAAYTSPEYTHCIRDARFRHNVYEPEADTFLFLEALDTDAPLLRSLAPRQCLEVGCGSGTVITHLRCLLMPATEAEAEGTIASSGGPVFYAVDVNPLALEATGVTWTDTLLKYFAASVLTPHFCARYHTAVPTDLAAPVVVVEGDAAAAAAAEQCRSSPSHPTAVTSPLTEASASPATAQLQHSTDQQPFVSSTYVLQRFQGDLFHPVRATLGDAGAAVFDVVLFNPPYVPTSQAELDDAVAKRDVITAAWCGGPRGRVVLDRFLEQLPFSLSRRGACYLVLIKENDVADVLAYAQSHFRCYIGGNEEGDVVEMTEVAARYTGEHLSVHRLRYLPRFCNE